MQHIKIEAPDTCGKFIPNARLVEERTPTCIFLYKVMQIRYVHSIWDYNNWCMEKPTKVQNVNLR